MNNYYYKICLLIVFILLIAFIVQKFQIHFTENFENQIPLHIYQTWHTKDLSPKMRQCVENLKMCNPEFEHHLLDVSDCREFIQQNFDKRVLDAYDKLKPLAFKADLWRYCVLYKNGGVYLDIKFQCEPNFKLIQLANSDLYVKEYWNGKYLDNAVYNGFLISAPNNQKFYKIIEKICNHVEVKYYDDFVSGQTGPYLFGRFFNHTEMDSIKYAYYEENGRGFVKNIDTDTNILSFYPEYRNEQKSFKKEYWQDMWKNKDVYMD